MKHIASFRSTFRRDEKGIAAVEFALILPAMLALYFGEVEVSRLAGASQKVNQVADMLADLTARKLTGGDLPGQAAITDTDLVDIFKAAQMIIAPLPISGLRLEIDELQAGDGGRNPQAPKVMWYVTYGDPPGHRECGSLTMAEASQNLDEFHTIPTSLAYAGTMSGYIISARAQYDYGAAATPVMFGRGSKLVQWSYKVPRVISTGRNINPLIIKATTKGNRAPSGIPYNVTDCFGSTSLSNQ